MKVHLIGICGTGMGSLAGLLKAAGHDVRGSDRQAYPPISVQLEILGIEIMIGFSPENLSWNPDVVVVGNICRKDHEEVVEAQRRGIRLVSMAALLSEEFLADKTSVVVAGTHGKTTCASLMAHLLDEAGQSPSFFIGGVPRNFGLTFRLGEGLWFVVEGDEYDTAFFDKKSKFLHYRPRHVLLTGVEYDHADIFGSIEAVYGAFEEFLGLIPADGLLVAHASVPSRLLDGVACPVYRYCLEGDLVGSFPEEVVWSAKVVSYDVDGITRFVVNMPSGGTLGPLETNLAGMHNLTNVLGCVTLAHLEGVTEQQIAGSLPRFLGVKRRQEVKGVAMGVTVVDDFAHHPTAVEETLNGLRGRYGTRRFIAVFEPRSATSRRNVFQKRFAEALSVADEVVVAPIYHAQELTEEHRLDPEQLASDIRANGTPARYFDSIDQIIEHLAGRTRPGDTVVMMSSGSFADLHNRLLQRIGDAVMPASLCDLKDLNQFLERMDLETEDLAARIESIVMLRGKEGLVGCIGLDVLGNCGLLWGLAVVPERRGEGLGWILAQAAIQRARNLRLDKIYMFGISTTAQTGQLLGFTPVRREQVEPFVVCSPEFQREIHEKAQLMCLVLSE